ncbi:serine-rich adhesin for platelets [Periplaneta americana]|uniref:serine-rich adhesin for platelets n=1 Tax=Periplaneta americana TaxID=6978 RepID=UPI0037E98970
MGVTKICPPPSELCVIKTNIHCPEEGCRSIFKNTANLDMHLIKHHKKENNSKKDMGVNYQYHCPIEECPYNLQSKQFFKCLKYLKQHYLKVHAEKSFQCKTCLKGFSTEAAKKHHSRICGIKFTCSCNNTYDTYEALLTHAKRSSHTFDEKFKLYGKGFTETAANKEKKSGANCREIQPVSTAIAVPVHFLAAVALSELSGKSLGPAIDKGVQTDGQMVVSKRSKKAPSPSKSCERATKRRMSAQTQTGIVPKNKRPKISAQTQTIGDYILKKAMEDANIPIPCESQKSSKQITKKRRKSMETQTMNLMKVQNREMNNFLRKYPHVDTDLASLNDFPSTSNISMPDNQSSYTLGVDVGLPDLWVGQKNSSGTQTSPVAMNALMEQEILSHSVTQTDLNLSFLESETCEANSSGIHSSSQTMHNLQTYFEDNSNCSFSNVVNNVTPAFEPELATSACGTNMETALGTLADDTAYSPSQMDSFLVHRKNDFNVNRSCSIETQTEIDFNDSFLTGCADDGDTSFTFCSTIETQTTEEFSSFDQLLYSNMYTQTCDDILYSELGFVNIQTQTAWPQFGGDDSMFVSTETQTALSGSTSVNKSWSASKMNSETSHMETQTDLDEFRELIAELSKQSPEDKLL